MTSFVEEIKNIGTRAISDLFGAELSSEELLVNETKPEFEGDYTLVLFPLLKKLRQNPQILGEKIGRYVLDENPGLIKGFNVIKGFLNLILADRTLDGFLDRQYKNPDFGSQENNGQVVMVEFSSPNTNKPLHLGHLRNIFLGDSFSRILKTCGYKVIKANLINDRGIHICKSMVAWLHFGEGKTPETTGIKGDHFVGDFYVRFNEEYKKQVEDLVASGMEKEKAEKEAPLQKEAAGMLLKWEKRDSEIISLWERMNNWVYKGFNESYERMGVAFDKIYHESETYLLGKDIVEEGLEKGLFFRKENGSVWIDLTPDGLDEKLLLRGDGTSVYMTQDLGTAELKYEDFHVDQSIYVIGDEQDYHMKVLKLILQKLGRKYADGIYHLSYGMVELPNGRMKSREGTVVDADDLMDDMIETARKNTEELGKVKDFSGTELEHLYQTLGLGAMKFYLLRVDPKKKMVFNPEESIDFQGFTAPFVQYTYARIQSIFRKERITADTFQPEKEEELRPFHPLEKKVILKLETFPESLKAASEQRDPSIVAIYVYELAKAFNSFYRELSVSNAEDTALKSRRIQLCLATAMVLKKGMNLLGIEVPDRM